MKTAPTLKKTYTEQVVPELVRLHGYKNKHEIPRLVTAGLLKPLGHPARNSTKFFATETLEQFRRDEKWLARASDAIASYWRERNARKQKARGRA